MSHARPAGGAEQELLQPLERNLFTPAFLDDPRPLLHRMREEEPVRWSDAFPPGGYWLVTRYEDADRVLRDPRFGKSDYWDQVGDARGGVESETVQVLRSWMSQLDPPDHTRVRKAFGRTFLPRMVERLRPRVEELVDELLDGLAAEPEFDVIADLAFTLPVIVICEMLGVPAADRGRFKDWSTDLARVFDVDLGDESLERSRSAVLAFRDYLRVLVEQRRAEPRDDILTHLVKLHDDQEGITEHELLSNVTLLVWAGHETTMNLIGNGVLTLLRHPDALARLRADLALAPQVVEEILRFEGPLRTTARIALEDVTLADRTIRAGQMTVIIAQAANGDPARFENPDVFEIGRPNSRSHLAFGGGIHFCLGAPLARLEAEALFSRLFVRFPRLALAEDTPRWNVNLFLRGLEALHVRTNAV
ncbi:cytochrome P450 [Streptomyces sp. NPDC001770]